jgi:glycosyltransferase involved in cell wall biosynthesis
MTPIVVCSVDEKCLPVMAASVQAYASKHWLYVNVAPGATFGHSYNAAMIEAFKHHDEIIIANDDVVLTPSTMAVFMADIAALKAEHGDRLGFVATLADNVRWDQTIRVSQPPAPRQARVISPIFAWVSKIAFEAAQFPPLNWYSDDVMCEDLNRLGFKHFISDAYVHHAGSQTIGTDNQKHIDAAVPWLRANRPAYLKEWLPHMFKPKIAVYAIAKNEEKHVERFWNSASEADLVLIADTGSTDRTVEIASKLFGTQVHKIHVSPWRFDVARNAALALLPDDIDICVTLDLDEVLQPGWREEIERLWMPGVTRMSYLFDCGKDHVIRQDKVHARNGYVWKGICHEYPSAFRIEERSVASDMILAVHQPDDDKSRGQYLDLLFAAASDDFSDHRASFYYARELYFHRRWGHALAEFTRFLSLPSAVWNKERCYAMRMMARCCYALDDRAGAIEWATSATEEDEGAREPWLELAMQAYHQELWETVLRAARRCLNISDRDETFVNDPEVWGSKPFDLLAIAEWRLGLKGDALEHAEQALKLEPTNKRLQQNVEMMQPVGDTVYVGAA